MDVALHELELGIEPAGRTLWGTVHPVSVNVKVGTAYHVAQTVPALFY